MEPMLFHYLGRLPNSILWVHHSSQGVNGGDVPLSEVIQGGRTRNRTQELHLHVWKACWECLRDRKWQNRTVTCAWHLSTGFLHLLQKKYLVQILMTTALWKWCNYDHGHIIMIMMIIILLLLLSVPEIICSEKLSGMHPHPPSQQELQNFPSQPACLDRGWTGWHRNPRENTHRWLWPVWCFQLYTDLKKDKAIQCEPGRACTMCNGGMMYISEG